MDFWVVLGDVNSKGSISVAFSPRKVLYFAVRNCLSRIIDRKLIAAISSRRSIL